MGQLCISDSNDLLLRDGKPFFYLADTVWAAFGNLPLHRWAPYLRYRKMQGFNALQISILPITHDASLTDEGLDPFLSDAEGNWDFYRLNEAYFYKAERLVKMAVEADFVPVLGVVWKNYVPGTLASQRSPIPSAMPLDAVEAYAKYAARRFRKYDPIFFISGDTAWDSDHEGPYYMAALEIVREQCPDALITMHLGTGRDIPKVFAEKMDFYMYQSGHRPEQKTPYELAQKHLAETPKRPVVNGEPCYEGHGKVPTKRRFEAFDMRKAIWQSLLSGAKMGTAYGAHGVWSCHAEGQGFVQPDRKFIPYDWEVGLRLDGAWDAGYAKWIWEQYGLWDVEAVDKVMGEDEEVRCSMNSDGSKMALYTPCAYDIELDMDLSGYQCTLIDLANRRPMVPVVEAGVTSTVRMDMFNGDALFLAVK